MKSSSFIGWMGAAVLAGCAGTQAGPELQQPGPEPQPPMLVGLYGRTPNAACLARATGEMPANLSQLGCFDANDPQWLAPGVIPFDVNAPLWIDGAHKERWFAIPDGSRITVDASGDFAMPPGSVMGKTFSIHGERIETRIMVHHPIEGFRGYSYRWNEIQSDATLVAEPGEELSAVGHHAVPWTFPGRSDCWQCHDAASNHPLGLALAQLQRTFVYPSTGRAANQVDTLRALGLLAETAARPPAQPLVDYRDSSQPITARARAYLHGNCASCHTSPEGYCSGDLRIAASDAETGVCDAQPKLIDPSWGWPAGTRLIAPGDPEASAILQRMRAPGGSLTAMPPLGRHGVHQEGVALIRQWIAEMPGCAP